MTAALDVPARVIIRRPSQLHPSTHPDPHPLRTQLHPLHPLHPSISPSRTGMCRSGWHSSAAIGASPGVLRADVAHKRGLNPLIGRSARQLSAKGEIHLEQRRPPWMVLSIEGQLAAAVALGGRAGVGAPGPAAQVDDLREGREVHPAAIRRAPRHRNRRPRNT